MARNKMEQQKERDEKGMFVEGGSSWNKGLKGVQYLKNYKNGHPKGMLGKKQSKETIEKRMKNQRGRKLSITTKEKISNSLMGHPFCGGKQSWFKKGESTKENHPQWIDLDSEKIIELYNQGILISKIAKRFNVSHSKVYSLLKHKNILIRSYKEERKKQVTPIKDTTIEVKIQNFLKELGIEFFTHQYMKIEHGYQCDVLIPSMNLVIECDGNYWHKYPVGLDKDHIRTNELIEKGFKVLRLWECEIKHMNIINFQERLKNG